MAQPLTLSIILDVIDKTAKLGQVSSRVTKMAQSMKQASIGVGLAGAAIVGGIGKGISELSKFEEAMAEVSTLTSTATVDMAAMAQGIRELARETGEGPAELAKALYQTVSAGVAAGEALEFLGVASKGAIGGVTDTFTAVDAATTIMNAYGIAAKDVAEITDMLQMTVDQGKTTWGELGGSIGRVAGIAAQSGVSTAELGAAIATLTTSMGSTELATTSLRAVMTTILSPTKATTDAAAELGIQWDLAALEAKGLVGLMAEVKEKGQGDAEALAALVPNVRALTGVMNLAGAQADQFAENLVQQQDAAGASADAYAKMSETTSRSLAPLAGIDPNGDGLIEELSGDC